MATQAVRISAAPKRRIGPLWQYLVGVAVAIIVLIPLISAMINGFKSTAELLAHPFGLPSIWKWDNYTSILQSAAFWRQLLNSTLVMAATAIGVLVLASMPAFVFSRMTFRGRDLLFNFFTLGLLFP